jgi:hypothetical protein
MPLVAMGVTGIGADIGGDGVGPDEAVVAGLEPSVASDSVGEDSSRKHAVADVISGILTFVQLFNEDPISSPRKMFRNHLRWCWNMFVVWFATVQKSSRTTSIRGLT